MVLSGSLGNSFDHVYVHPSARGPTGVFGGLKHIILGKRAQSPFGLIRGGIPAGLKCGRRARKRLRRISGENGHDASISAPGFRHVPCPC